jgi:tRNA(Ile)-lysidine synthase
MTADELAAVVARVCRSHGAVGTPLIVGVSGGADSMTLLHLMRMCREELGVTIVVAHLDHGLRGADGAADAEAVRDHAIASGLPVVIDRVDTSAHARETGMGPEAAARDLRYVFFRRTAEEAGARFVLTAHTCDDQAETVLMHLARGSGIRGLSGMPPARPLTPDITVLRPLLDVARSDVHDVARACGLEWRHDASNDDPLFLRNRVRAVLVPALREVFGPSILSSIARSADLVREADAALRGIAEELHQACVWRSDDSLAFNVDAMSTLPRAIAAEIVRTARTVNHDECDRILALLAAEAGSIATLRGGQEAVRERDRVLIRRAGHADDRITAVAIDGSGAYVAGSQTLTVAYGSAGTIHPTPDPTVAYVDARSIRGRLVWRPWQDGDRFHPFGLDGTVLVSDLLTNVRVPHAERRSVRVVADDDGILWVCGIRPAERTRVTATTDELLILSLRP